MTPEKLLNPKPLEPDEIERISSELTKVILSLIFKYRVSPNDLSDALIERISKGYGMMDSAYRMVNEGKNDLSAEKVLEYMKKHHLGPKKPDGGEIHRSVDKIVTGILGLLKADPSLKTRAKVERIARGLVKFAWAAKKKRVSGTWKKQNG